MPSNRRFDNRAGRRGKQRRPSGRQDPDPQARRRNGNDSSRQLRTIRAFPGNQKILIMAGVGVAAVLFILAIAVMSGGRTRPAPRPRPVVVRQTPASPVDWYSMGYSRGLRWKTVIANRAARPTFDEVQLVAERMTSDYARKGIDAEGEKRFVLGFKRAVLGQ